MKPLLITAGLALLVGGCADLTKAPDGGPDRFSADTQKAYYSHTADNSYGYFFVNGTGTKSFSVLGGYENCSLEGNRVTWRQACEEKLGEACYMYRAGEARYWNLADRTTFDRAGQHEKTRAACVQPLFLRMRNDL